MVKRTSRLKRLESRRALKSAVFWIVLSVGTIYLLINFGLPALSNLTSFITGVAREDIVDTGVNGPPPPPPQINTPTRATNEEKITIRGRTRPGYTVSVFFNDERTEVLADAGGEFTGVFALSEGNNTLYATVADNGGQISVKTRTYNIVFDNEAPDINVISPENNSQFFGSNQRQVKIEGETEPGARVTINDRIAIVRSDGKFDYTTSLSEGENIFKVKAMDDANNEIELELKLTFAI
jgi:hypothetical protein